MNKTVLTISALAAATVLTLGASCTKTTTTNTNGKTNTNTVTTKVNTNAAVNTNTTPAVVFNAAATSAQVLADVNGQWAATATASTQYGSDSWSANQATGEPDVDVEGDNANAWAPLEKNKGTETLELSFTKAVYASGVRIRESLGEGAVTKVELKDIDGNYHSVFSGTDSTSGLNYLQIAVATTTYKVNGVRVTLNTTLSPNDWAEIDAVQLVGQ